MTQVHTLDRVVIRFAGDSGDGMQLTGDRFTADSAVFGNDISTLPNFPAEIRAPAGTLPGVSSFQLHFANYDIMTPGDRPDVLVAMNPAALKANIADLARGGVIIADTADFTKRNLAKVGYEANPLEDGSLTDYQLHALDLTGMTVEAVKKFGLTRKDASRAKNMFALGLLSWLYSRPTEGTINFLSAKFAGKPAIRDANITAFKTGYAFGETTETFAVTYEVAPAPMPAGQYRQISGNLALAFGLITAARKAGLPLFLGAYPITPASDVLHELSKHKRFGVTTFQAEDEIAGVGAALGASFAGQLGVTTTSGPGVALKAETIGLAVMTELPLVVCDIQRAGPSTGHADQDRAGGPAAGDVRPQRRGAGAGPGRAVAGRLLRDRDRSGDAGGEVPHAGDLAVRRLYRQRSRAVAGSGPERDPGHRSGVRHPTQRHRPGGQRDASTRTAAMRRRWPGRGRSPAPPDCSTASAVWRRPRTPGRSPTTRRTTKR